MLQLGYPVVLLGWGRGGIAAPGVQIVVCKEENKEKLTYIYNNYRKRSISEYLEKRWEAERCVIMKPYGG